ncbi:MAG: hypothetical protein ACJA2S_000952 [Cyclobacteriaceae bacterium]|jgi:hypothetical protein
MKADNNTVTDESVVKDFRIFKEDNNLDKQDNLNELPKENAIYTICSRINGEPANCRFVGLTDDLQNSIKIHFSGEEQDGCLREFMQSIKIKTINYMLLHDLSGEERDLLLEQWRNEYKPECNDELNKVY